MAVEVLWDAFVELNSVDRSAQVSSVSLPMSIAELDTALMGDDTVLNEPGLKSFSCEIEFKNDFTDDEEDEDFFALWDARTKFTVAIRKSKTDSVGTGNPSYEFTGFIAAWNPIQGAKGQLVGGTMRISNSTALSRETT
jgi:hypothetical protein